MDPKRKESKSSTWVVAVVALLVMWVSVVIYCCPKVLDPKEYDRQLSEQSRDKSLLPDVAFDASEPNESDGFEIVQARQPQPSSVDDSDAVEIPSDEEVQRIESGEDDPSVEFAEQVTEGSSGPAKALPSRKSWINEFNKTRRAMSKTHPLCEACGRSAAEAGGHIDMHHVISVKRIIEEKLDRSLLTDKSNMIELCRGTESNCHLRYGHTVDGHSSWSISNPHVRRDAARNLANCWPDKTYRELVEDYYRNQVGPAKPQKRVRAKTVPAKTTISP